MSCSTMFFGNTKINNLTKHISINFTRSNISGGIIEPDELAGAIPVKNWNNITTDICNNFSSRYIPRFMFNYWSNSNYYTSNQNPGYYTYYIHNGDNLYQDIFTQAIWGTQTHTIFTTNDYYYTANIDNDVYSNPQNINGSETWGPQELFHFQSRNASTSIFDIKIEYYRFGLYYTISEHVFSTNTITDIVQRTLFNMTNTVDTYARNFLFRLKIDFTSTTPKLTISKLVFWKNNSHTGTDISLIDNYYTAWQHKEFQPSQLAGYKNWHIRTFRNYAGHLNMKFDYMISPLLLDDTNLTGNITQNLISGIKPLKDSKGKLLVNTKLIQTPNPITRLHENYSKDYDRNAHDAYIINAPNNNKSINDYNNYTSNIKLFKGYTECYDRIDIIDIPEDFRNSTYDVRIYTSFDSDHYSNNGDPVYQLIGWNDYIGTWLYNRTICVGSVDNSFVYPVINKYKRYNNSGAIANIVSPYIWDLTTGAMSDNDPYVKTSISNSGFVGTELGWAAVSHYANGGTAYYSNNNYAIFKGLSVTNISITSIDSNFNKIGGIQITKNN